MNWSMEVLQTSALPLGYAASVLERETGFEPATSTLARLHSTTELLPLNEEEFYRLCPVLSTRFFQKRKIFFCCKFYKLKTICYAK